MSKTHDEGYVNPDDEESTWVCSFFDVSGVRPGNPEALFGGPDATLGDWTPDKLNSPEFGVALWTAEEGADSVALVESIEVRVYYTIGSAVDYSEARRPASLSSVAEGAAAVVVVGAGGRVLRSADYGASWTEIDSGVTVDLRRVRYLYGRFYAVGDAGTLVHSLDEGLTWSELDTGTDIPLRGIAANSRGVTLVGRGVALHSIDRQAWRSIDSG